MSQPYGPVLPRYMVVFCNPTGSSCVLGYMDRYVDGCAIPYRNAVQSVVNPAAVACYQTDQFATRRQRNDDWETGVVSVSLPHTIVTL